MSDKYTALCIKIIKGLDYEPGYGLKYKAKQNAKSMKEQVALFLPQQRADGWCKSAGVRDEIHSADAGDEPDRGIGYHASSEPNFRLMWVAPRVCSPVPDGFRTGVF